MYVHVHEIMLVRCGQTCKSMVGIVNMCYDGNFVAEQQGRDPSPSGGDQVSQ